MPDYELAEGKRRMGATQKSNITFHSGHEISAIFNCQFLCVVSEYVPGRESGWTSPGIRGIAIFRSMERG